MRGKKPSLGRSTTHSSEAQIAQGSLIQMGSERKGNQSKPRDQKGAWSKELIVGQILD